MTCHIIEKPANLLDSRDKYDEMLLTLKIVCYKQGIIVRQKNNVLKFCFLDLACI